MLKQRILNDKTQALRERNSAKRLVLSTLVGELDNSGKNPDDVKIISIIKKMIENNKITNCEDENIYLEVYLPVEMSDIVLNERIVFYINELKRNGDVSIRNMKDVMNFLSSNYPGEYDGKKVSIIAKKLLI